MQSKFWNDITSRIGEPDDASGVETGGLPDIPTPAHTAGSEALEQATASWVSKGVVTFPCLNGDFKPHLLFLKGFTGSDADKVYSVESYGATSARRFEYSVGAFTNNAATATRDSTTNFGETIQADSGSVDGTNYYIFYERGSRLELKIYTASSGSLSRTANFPSPNPSKHAIYIGNNRVYALDSACSPTTLKAYTIPGSGNLTADSTNDISLVAGAGRASITNVTLLTDGTYIWIAGLSSANTISAWCYQISNGSRVSARDISYTDTEDLSWISSTSDGDVYVLRRGTFADDNTNTARMLEYRTPTPVAPTWTRIPPQTTGVNNPYELDVSTYLSGSPAPTVTMTGNPSWLTISGTTLSGTPTASASAVTVTLTATNASGTARRTFTLTVAREAWLNKGVVTLTREFPASLRFASIIQFFNHSTHDFVRGWRVGFNRLYAWSVAENALRHGTATSTAGGQSVDRLFVNTSGQSLSFAYSTYYLFSSESSRVVMRRFANSGARAGRLYGTYNLPTPAPSSNALLIYPRTGLRNGVIYALDRDSSPTTLKAYTPPVLPRVNSIPGPTETLTADSTKDITLATGAGTQALTNPILFSDNTYIWIAGINPSNARQVLGYAYNLSTRARASSRDISYTDTENLARVTMSDYQYVYAIRRRGDCNTEVTNTARVLQFSLPTASSWETIPDQNADAGTYFTFDVSQYLTGIPFPTLSISGLTGTGMSFCGTTISGTPTRTQARASAYPITITATNTGGTASETFNLSIRSEPEWLTIPNFRHRVNRGFRLDLASYVSGIPTPTITERNNSFPSWLSISGTTISGTPTASACPVRIHVTATNAVDSANASFTIEVTAALVAPSGNIANQTATAGTAFNLNLADYITGNPDPTFSVSGLSGTGLCFSGTTISGTPERSNARATAYPITVQARNSQGTITRTFNLMVRSLPQWCPISNRFILQNSPLNLDIASNVNGIPTPTIALRTDGVTNPSWVTLTGTTLGGTPTAIADPASVYLRATNAAGTADTDFTIQVLQAPAAAARHDLKITPLTTKVTCSTEPSSVFLLEFDDDVEASDVTVAALENVGVQLPDSAITIRQREARTIEARNAPCSTRRFAYGATYTLNIEVRPKLATAPTTTDFTVTGGTLTSVTELSAGQLYALLVTFPSSGTGTTTVTARASQFDGVDSNIELMTCLYGADNLRTANFPIGIQPESTSVTFDIIAEPNLTATPLLAAISVTAGSVISVCEIRAGQLYRVTLSLPAGTGTVTVTALATGFTNITANQTLGMIQYRAV